MEGEGGGQVGTEARRHYTTDGTLLSPPALTHFSEPPTHTPTLIILSHLQCLPHILSRSLLARVRHQAQPHALCQGVDALEERWRPASFATVQANAQDMLPVGGGLQQQVWKVWKVWKVWGLPASLLSRPIDSQDTLSVGGGLYGRCGRCGRCLMIPYPHPLECLQNILLRDDAGLPLPSAPHLPLPLPLSPAQVSAVRSPLTGDAENTSPVRRPGQAEPWHRWPQREFRGGRRRRGHHARDGSAICVNRCGVRYCMRTGASSAPLALHVVGPLAPTTPHPHTIPPHSHPTPYLNTHLWVEE